MNNKTLEKAMIKAVKVFKKSGYKVSSKSISENGSLISLNIIAEPKEDKVNIVRYLEKKGVNPLRSL